LFKELRDEHVEDILNTLLYDDKIEVVKYKRGEYKVSGWDQIIKPSILAAIPCGGCPVFHECKELSLISPEKCVYFSEW
jgi:hypothetical protein